MFLQPRILAAKQRHLSRPVTGVSRSINRKEPVHVIRLGDFNLTQMSEVVFYASTTCLESAAARADRRRIR